MFAALGVCSDYTNAMCGRFSACSTLWDMTRCGLEIRALSGTKLGFWQLSGSSVWRPSEWLSDTAWA
jgi:hypothetical protein